MRPLLLRGARLWQQGQADMLVHDERIAAIAPALDDTGEALRLRRQMFDFALFILSLS